MARLLPGENEKIDNINRLVSLSHSMNEGESNKAIVSLLGMFKPMILKLCTKWSKYFQDDRHNIIHWDVLVADAEFWFIHYTTKKYIVDGSATYNKFIRDHIDQRIRYIYESELKYLNQNIFPDPNRNSSYSGDGDGNDMFDDVVNKYCTLSTCHGDIDDMMIDREIADGKKQVCNAILMMVNDRAYFTERETLIFTECMINGKTHDAVATDLSISRTRVSQIVGRIRKKIFDLLDDQVRGWELKIHGR